MPGQSEDPVPQVAHMQDHTLYVCCCIRAHWRRPVLRLFGTRTADIETTGACWQWSPV
jgi:hypothetical protein